MYLYLHIFNIILLDIIFLTILFFSPILFTNPRIEIINESDMKHELNTIEILWDNILTTKNSNNRSVVTNNIKY